MIGLLRFTCALAALTAMLGVWAYPNLYAENGLVQTPSAQVTPFPDFALAVNYARISDGAFDAPVYPIRLSYGASPNAELGAFFAETPVTEQGRFSAYGGAVKVQFSRERLGTGVPALAVGARFTHQATVASTDIMQAYLVLSKTLYARRDPDRQGNSFNMSLHAGGMFTNYSGNGPQTQFTDAFGGVSFTTVDGTQLVVDYVPEQKKNNTLFRRSTISGAVRVPVADEFLLEIGATRPYGIGENLQPYLGLTYHYNPRLHDGEINPFL